MTASNGSELFLETLLDEGVRVIFGNPGTTELPLMDALVNEDRLDYILCLQEAVAIGAAEGYAFATGGPAVLNLHVAPGLGNALGMLYNSKRAGSPLIVTAGNQPQHGMFQEIVLWDDIARMAEPLVKWSYEVRRVEDLEQAVRRAIKVALTPPTGPVFLSFPGDVMLAPAGDPTGRPTRIDTRYAASGESIRRAARILAKAQNPIIVTGSRITRSGAEEELARLAERLGAKVYGETFPNTIAFAMDHPLYAGELPRLAKPVRKRLEEADVVFLAGTEAFILSFPPDAVSMPEHVRVVQLDLNPWEIGKNFPAEAALFGDPKTTLPLLLAEVEAAGDEGDRSRARARREKVEGEVRELRARETPAILPASEEPEGGMSLTSFHAALGEAIPPGTAIIDEAISSAGPGFRRGITEKAAHLFGIKGGGIGMGMPTALGVKKGMPERPVVGVSGDGSSMYTIQALWTAARYNIAAAFVVINNGAYRILKERVLNLDGKAKEFHKFVAMDLIDPALDFPKLAEGMGVAAIRAQTPGALKDAIGDALASGKPCLIDAVVKSEEL